MDFNIQFINTSPDSSIEQMVKENLITIKEKFDWTIRAAVYIKKENTANGKGKICEMLISVPGPRIFASANEESFEAAIAQTSNNLERLLNQRKEEMKTKR
jgi:putative sigma-54 modulation protein